jgi:hypothetical protein
MSNLFIKLRKKMILPRRWKKQEQKRADGINIPDKMVFIELQKKAKEKHWQYLRKNDKMKSERMGEVDKLVEALIDNKLEDYLADM